MALVRVEEFAASVAYRLGRLRTELAGFGAGELLNEGASRDAWAAVRDAAVLPVGDGEAVWRVSVRPSRGPAVLAAAAAAGGRGYLDWGGGLAMLAGPASQAMHAAITGAAAQAGGVWMLLRAPEPMRAAVEVVPAEAAALRSIGRRIKSVMDPRGILNPGRLVAGV